MTKPKKNNVSSPDPEKKKSQKSKKSVQGSDSTVGSTDAHSNAKSNSASKSWYKQPLTIVIAALVVIAIVVAIIYMTRKPVVRGGQVEILEFTDFGCPFCAKSQSTLNQLKAEYGDSIKITFKHFPIEQLHPDSPKAHEASECARDQGKFEEYKDWLFANQGKHDVANLKKAAVDLGLNLQQFSECLDSGAKQSTVTADFNEGRSKGVEATPTFFVNGEEIRGAQPISTFRKVIDAELAKQGGQPIQQTQTAAVNLTILNDERCKNCDVSPLVPKLEEIFGTINVKEIDYNSAEGQALYEQMGTGPLPMMLFEKSVIGSDAYDQISQYFQANGEYMQLMIGSNFDPTKEICDNNIDDTNDGEVDCADADCSGQLVCRPELKGDLQVFIMSDCPYGKLAVLALNDIVNTFGDDINWSIHYIATKTPTGFRSLHGQYEADEDMIQLCVNKYSPAKYLDFMVCRSEEGIKGNDWHNCAASTGVDEDAVTACFDSGEGASLLADDIVIGEELEVTGSPTWLANNKYQFGGIDAADIQSSICQYNDFDGCADTIASSSNNAPAGSCH